METASPLAALLGPEQAARFRGQHFPGRLFHHQADAACWPAWLQSEALQRTSALDPLYRGELDATRGGRATYRLAGASPSRLVDDLGLTVRLGELDQHLVGATAWLRALEQELGLPVRSCALHGFVNAPGVGLGAHCDPSEHLLIHVRGRKHIQVAPSAEGSFYGRSHSLHLAPSASDAAQREAGYAEWGAHLPPDAETIELRPGAVLFMPRGCYHETRGGDDGVSLSVVVRMHIPSYAELWVDYLRDYLGQDAAWRTPAAGAWSTDAAARAAHHDRLGTLIAAASSQLAALDRAPPFAPRDANTDVTACTRFVRNPAVLLEVDSQRSVLAVREEQGHGATRENDKLGPSALELVERIGAYGVPFTLAELQRAHAGWDEEALRSIVSFLVRQQVLIAVHVERYRG